MSKQPLDLQAVREHLAATQGQQYWRSLDQLANTDDFQNLMEREFPRHASEMRDPAGRRNFLKLMGASLAMAGLSGCALRQPQEHIVPYVRLPEQVIPGKPLFFASAHTFQGYAQGILVESHEGRPTKIEGNADHPASLGRTDVFMQASVLQMYDPDRSQKIANAGATKTWPDFTGALATALANAGTGTRLLTGTITSPTLAAQIKQFLTANAGSRWYVYDPVGFANTNQGAQQAFGQNVNSYYDFTKANVVLALDADFFAYGPANVRYQYDFMSRRKIRTADKNVTMNRLYVAEPTMSITGTNADHRLPLQAAQIGALASAIAAAVGVAGVQASTLPQDAAAWAASVAKDLQANRGTSAVVVGEGQPAAVHALGHAINAALGNVGATVLYTAPVAAQPTRPGTLVDLVNEMNGGQVKALVMLESNPVYAAPADLDFAAALAKVPFSVHYGQYVDETAEKATWHVPSTHYLEHWSDARAFDGTTSIVQPLIAPIYGAKSPHELLAALGGQANAKGYDIVRAAYTPPAGTDATLYWQEILNAGLVPNTKAATTTPTLAAATAASAASALAAGSYEVVFQPDTKLWDGTYANNGWLQELPNSITKIAWDNVAYIGPKTAQTLAVATGDIISIASGGRTIEAPVWVQPGTAENVVALQLGYGRTKAGIVGNLEGKPVGYNAYALRTSAAPYFATDGKVAKTGRTYELASTQDHHSISLQSTQASERGIIHELTLADYREDPNKFLHGEHEVFNLYPTRQFNGYAWGMSIDLNICTGCNACVIACQSENNIAVVGKTEVLRGREMQWIRIDRYFGGANIDNPTVVHQPMACQQCEQAPCEVVCPVGATVHDSEGLNNMVYNRCVGTKYCSNNCPFKVRRFNFFQYNDMLYKFDMDSLKMMRNPDVTVRVKGVMEKCTYCVQRIAEVRQDKERVNDTIKDGEVVTACQAACPTEAITFGNLNDATSKVTQLRRLPLSYTLLNELNVRARTSYMAQVKNPNPELQQA